VHLKEFLMSKDTTGMPIVVGVDGSTPALHAAVWAANTAAQRHEPLRLVFASNSMAFGYGAWLAPPQSYFDELQASSEKLVADVETALRREHPALEIAVELQTASPIPTLIAQTDEARLLVLGSRGTGGFGGMLAGSTAVALVAHGHCSVAVIRGAGPDGLPPTEGPVVVGIDGSSTSEAAVATAFDEASWRGADLVAVHSWIENAADADLLRPGDAGWAKIEQNEEEVLAERMAGWQEKYPDVAVRRVLTQGKPAERLLEHAVNAQLIVVGSRGRGGISGMLLGSTSQALIYHATCPLLVVRPTDG
jgi:nucleotide-binding universal stress UspA family protein